MAYPIVPVDMLLDRKLSALFAMSVLGGFALFSLVFYVPLLFQGGYAMSPHDSGMLITPLLLGTTRRQRGEQPDRHAHSPRERHHVCRLCAVRAGVARASSRSEATSRIWSGCHAWESAGSGSVWWRPA